MWVGFVIATPCFLIILVVSSSNALRMLGAFLPTKLAFCFAGQGPAGYMPLTHARIGY
jgi:hypothetical protein